MNCNLLPLTTTDIHRIRHQVNKTMRRQTAYFPQYTDNDDKDLEPLNRSDIPIDIF